MLVVAAAARDAGDPRGAQVGAALMQDQLGRRPPAVGDEGDLRGDRLVEELAIALGKQLELGLAGELREQPVALPRDGENGIGSALIEPGIAVVQIGIDRDRGARALLLGAPALDLVGPRPGRPRLRLIDSERREYPAVLVQDQRGRRSLVAGDEGDLLSGEELVEILALARGQEPPLRPAGELREQLVAFPRDRDDATRVQLVIADIAVEQLRIDFDGRSRPRLLGNALVEQLRRPRGGRGIDPRRLYVPAGLVEDHPCAIRPKRDALIDHAVEERALAFGKHLELGLTGALREQVVALAHDRQHQVGKDLRVGGVVADVAVELMRGKRIGPRRAGRSHVASRWRHAEGDRAGRDRDHGSERRRDQRALAPAHARRLGRAGEDALDATANGAGPRHGNGGGRVLDVAGNVEQDERVGRPVIQLLERGIVADDLRELRQPDELPPGEGVEPEHRAIERRQQQHIEIAVGDVRSLVRKHCAPLFRAPMHVFRG